MPASSLLWFVATALHVVLTFRLAWRMPALTNIDERIWVGSLATVGILAAVIHLLAAAGGLSIAGGVALLATAHLVMSWPGAPATRTAERLGWQEAAAVACWIGLGLTWLAASTASAAVVGTDAASYHAPNAINIARGVGIFDLPATQHLYPQLASAIGAWFVLPFDGPTAIDVSMLLPLLVMAASMNLVFRLATGLSGLAWCSWLVLVLLAVPLVRFSTHFSADLWFTAGYLAVMAAVLRLWRLDGWTGTDMLAAATAAGLLLGSKTTGVAALALMCGVWIVLQGARALTPSGRPRLPRHPLLWAIAAAAVVVGTGGIWLVRNWVLFGSPLAPSGLSIAGITIFAGESLQNSLYLSVLADLQNEDYALADRVIFHLRRWVGWWYLPAVALLCLLPIDAVAARARGRDDTIAIRLGLLILTVVPGVVLAWLLVGAPWTSLEWTQGFSLRYALPVLVSLLLVAVVALFPVSVRWYASPHVGTAGAVAAIAGSAWLFARNLTGTGPRFTAWPTIELSWLAVGVVAVAILPHLSFGRYVRIWAVVALIVVAGGAWVPAIARTTDASRAAIEAAFREQVGSVAAVEQHRAPLVAAGSYEAAAGGACEARRFFVLSRFDLPLELQDPHYRSVVFYAGRDPALLPGYAPIGRCDYIVATPAILGTDRGWTTLATLAGGRPLQRLAGTGAFVTYTPTGLR